MGKAFYWIEKTLYLSLGFLITVLVLSFLKAWSFDQNRYFLFVGDTESVIVIVVIGFAVTFILERLWKWEVREIFRPRAKRRGKR